MIIDPYQVDNQPYIMVSMLISRYLFQNMLIFDFVALSYSSSYEVFLRRCQNMDLYIVYCNIG